MLMKIEVFWNTTPFRLVNNRYYFGRGAVPIFRVVREELVEAED